MVSAFLAMEPPDVVISLARDVGGGSLDDRVQSCIWRQCICKAVGCEVARSLLEKVFEETNS